MNMKGGYDMKSKFLQFATSSFMGFLIDYALFCGLSFLFPDTENYILLANAAARVVSAICNYTINCRLVFKEKPTVKSAASYFALAALILCMNNVVLLVHSAIPDLSLYIAKAFHMSKMRYALIPAYQPDERLIGAFLFPVALGILPDVLREKMHRRVGACDHWWDYSIYI